MIDKRYKNTEKEDMRIKRDVTSRFAATLTNEVVYFQKTKRYHPKHQLPAYPVLSPRDVLLVMIAKKKAAKENPKS